MKSSSSIHRLAATILGGVLAISLSACAGLSHRENSALVGTVAGGVVGAAVTGGSTIGTVGGAAVGGVIGNEVGKKK